MIKTLTRVLTNWSLLPPRKVTKTRNFDLKYVGNSQKPWKQNFFLNS